MTGAIQLRVSNARIGGESLLHKLDRKVSPMLCNAAACIQRPAGVALTTISASSTHKNIAVRKIMDAARTAHAKKKWDSVSTRAKHARGKRSQHTSIVKGKRASFANNISVFR